MNIKIKKEIKVSGAGAGYKSANYKGKSNFYKSPYYRSKMYLERSNNLFYEIHVGWKQLLYKKAFKYLQDVKEDIIEEYLGWFLKYHSKFFVWKYHTDKILAGKYNSNQKKMRYNRAKNYYIQRFRFYVNHIESRKIYESKYAMLNNEHSEAYNLVVNGFTNIADDSTSINVGKFSDVIFTNVDSFENKIYFNQFINFINKKVIMNFDVKSKIVKFIDDCINNNMFCEVRDFFQTKTFYYRNTIKLLLSEFDSDKFDRHELNMNTKYKFQYSII